MAVGGVLEGSMLTPLLFKTYMKPLRKDICQFGSGIINKWMILIHLNHWLIKFSC